MILHLLPQFWQYLCLCGSGLVGPAPTTVRWTCLMLDLQYTLSVYLNRCYSYLKSVKLCANMAVKNMFTSDLFLDPGETPIIQATDFSSTMIRNTDIHFMSSCLMCCHVEKWNAKMYQCSSLKGTSMFERRQCFQCHRQEKYGFLMGVLKEPCKS